METPGGDYEYIDVTITGLHYDTGSAPPERRAHESAGQHGHAGRPDGLAVSSSPVGEPAKPAHNPVNAAKIVQATKARGPGIFTGKLLKKHLSFSDRALVSAVRAQEGDFRNWDDIRAQATRIADTRLPKLS